MSRPNILIARNVDPDLRLKLETVGDLVDVNRDVDGDNRVFELLRNSDGILCSSLHQLPTVELEKCAPRIKIISNFGVGFDNVDITAATRLGIRVCNTPGVLDIAVSEMCLALILGVSRRIVEADRFARDGKWGEEPFPLGADLYGKTLGVVGFGRIGQAVTERARAFGMSIIYSDIVDFEHDSAKRVSFETLLSEADVVSLHVSLTDETRGLINRDTLKAMKKTAILVNTARGPIVNQGELCRALKDRVIAGAAIDVTDLEPAAPDDPVFSTPNLIVTPHIGTATLETRRRMAELCVGNLVEVLSGRDPIASVN